LVPICEGGTVPIPGYEHQSKLLGTFHSQGGRDGFFSSIFSLNLFSLSRTHSYRQISRGPIIMSAAASLTHIEQRCSHYWYGRLGWNFKKARIIGNCSDVFHLNKTCSSSLLSDTLPLSTAIRSEPSHRPPPLTYFPNSVN
jgi:hypothetical protein